MSLTQKRIIRDSLNHGLIMSLLAGVQEGFFAFALIRRRRIEPVLPSKMKPSYFMDA
jgi:hypothetical protein